MILSVLVFSLLLLTVTILGESEESSGAASTCSAYGDATVLAATGIRKKSLLVATLEIYRVSTVPASTQLLLVIHF